VEGGIQNSEGRAYAPRRGVVASFRLPDCRLHADLLLEAVAALGCQDTQRVQEAFHRTSRRLSSTQVVSRGPHGTQALLVSPRVRMSEFASSLWVIGSLFHCRHRGGTSRLIIRRLTGGRGNCRKLTSRNMHMRPLCGGSRLVPVGLYFVALPSTASALPNRLTP
jgi:hypothetical protein